MVEFESILHYAADGLRGLEALDTFKPDLVFVDDEMPVMSGLEFLERMQSIRGDLPVIVQTAHGSIEAVISAMRAGAYDFGVKPVGAERLLISIKNALKTDALEDELRRVKRRAAGHLGFRDLAMRSPEMDRIVRLGERAAKSTIPVLRLLVQQSNCFVVVERGAG